MINILWVDDEYESYRGLIRKASRDFGINLDPYTSKQAGLKAYLDNPDHYEGILLDGCILEKNDSHPGTENKKYSTEFIREIKKIDPSIMICVLTGNPDGSIDQNFKEAMNTAIDVKYYEKTREDELKVLEILKSAALNKDEYRFKVRYQNIYNLYEVELLKKSSIDRLVIFDGILNDRDNKIFEIVNVRKVIEDLLSHMCDVNFLSNGLKGTEGWVFQSINALKSKKLKVGNTKIIPPMIISLLNTLRIYANDGTHDSGGSTLGVDTYVVNSRNNFFTFSIIYILFEILDFFGKIHQEIKNPLNYWEEANYTKIEATILKISDDNYVTCTSDSGYITIPPKLAKNYQLEIGMKVALEATFDRKQHKWFTNKIVDVLK